MQIYKKLLVIFIVVLVIGINFSCHRNVIPRTFSTKPRVAFSISYREYRFKGSAVSNACKKQRVNNRIPKEVVKEQHQLKKEHLSMQTKEVLEMMKASKKESDRLNRKGATKIDEIMDLFRKVF